MAKAKKTSTKAKASGRKVQTTLGDLIAAAFEATGRNAKAAAKLVSSDQMSNVVGRRIIFV
jgi:hypothetical protein